MINSKRHNTNNGIRILSVLIIIFIIVVFFAIGLRTATRQILVKEMNMDNAFTQFVLFDAQNLRNGEHVIDIDWEKQYPHNETVVQQKDEQYHSALDNYEEKINSIENSITKYATDFLPFYRKISELANRYEKIICWNFSPPNEYNNVISLPNGYLVGSYKKLDFSEMAESLSELAAFCKKQGTDFVYFQIPSKICKYEDADISGTMDFSNQNMDDLLNLLELYGVNVYDHRADIHNECLDHHALFYKTDHHWTIQTGLWASKHILQYLKTEFDYKVDTNLLDSENFEEVVYSNYFLGSQGKKVTLSVADPEDFVLLYPKFETKVHYEIPNLAIDEYGEFEIMYDLSCIKNEDYYNNNPYAAFNHADRPLIRIENELIDDGLHVLIVHESMSNCVIPFMSMEVKYLDCVDLRFFDGSLRTLITKEKPDVVIVTYGALTDTTGYSFQ